MSVWLWDIQDTKPGHEVPFLWNILLTLRPKNSTYFVSNTNQKKVNKPVVSKLIKHQTSITYGTFIPGSCSLSQATHFLQPMLWPHTRESIGFRSPSSMRSQQIRQSKDDNLERKKLFKNPTELYNNRPSESQIHRLYIQVWLQQQFVCPFWFQWKIVG